MFESFQKLIRHLIADGRLESALGKMEQAARRFSDNRTANRVLVVLARFRGLEREHRVGVISDQDFNSEFKGLSADALELLEQTVQGIRQGSGVLSGIYKDRFPDHPGKQDHFYIRQFGNCLYGQVKRFKPEDSRKMFEFEGRVECRVMMGYFYPTNQQHVSRGSLFLTRENNDSGDVFFKGYYLRLDQRKEQADPFGVERIAMELHRIDDLPDEFIEDELNKILV